MTIPPGCKAFGAASTPVKVEQWFDIWRDELKRVTVLLLLAGSRTAEVEGISAAGATAFARRFTAVADAELLLYGPFAKRRWPLPPLSAGVSPALISYVATRFLGVDPMILAAGLSQFPPFPHLLLELPTSGPSACVTTGKSMNIERVQSLWNKGFLMGLKAHRPLVIAECVPGGTTTAQAVLTGLGVESASLISGSIRNPPVALKEEIVRRGLQAAGLGLDPLPENLLAAVGDPFQPIAVGLLLGAREAGQQVLLGGGSQMLAVLALALRVTDPSKRKSFVEGITLATTSWLVEEGSHSSSDESPLVRLMDSIGELFGVGLFGVASGLRFHSSSSKLLKDYELGYVKEGVGAGALALLAQLKGVSCIDLVHSCEKAVDQLQGQFGK